MSAPAQTGPGNGSTQRSASATTAERPASSPKRGRAEGRKASASTSAPPARTSTSSGRIVAISLGLTLNLR